MKTIFLSLFCFASFSLWAQNDPRSIIETSRKRIQSYKSFNYEASYKMRLIGLDDTQHISGNVRILKNDLDTVFKGMVWVSSDSLKTCMFYDMQNIYKLNTAEKKAIVYPLSEKEYFSRSKIFNIVPSEFLDESIYDWLLASENKFTLLPDTTISNKDCYQISVRFPDKDDISDYKLMICFDKETYIPLYKREYLKFQLSFQFTEFSIKSYSLNDVSPEQFSKKQIPEDYAIDYYKEEKKSDEYYKLLDSGAIAPTIIGRNLSKDLVADTLDFIGKITILDFWYMGCIPCIKLMPEIEKLKEKYKDQIQVFGINNYDNNDKGIKKLPPFLEYNKVNYPTILVDENILTKYLVHIWPTVYIIDKTGKVHATAIGYGDVVFPRLSTAIDELLQANE